MWQWSIIICILWAFVVGCMGYLCHGVHREILLTYLLTHLLTHSLTPHSTVLLEKLTGLQLDNKFPTFSLPHSQVPASCPYPEPAQSSPYPTSYCLKIHVNISSHLRLGLPSGLFPSGFPTKSLYTSLSSLIRTTSPARLILLYFITRTIVGEQYRS
jgi:hypothetical protein